MRCRGRSAAPAAVSSLDCVRVSASRDEIVAFLDAELETHRYRDYAPIGMQVIGAESVERVASAVSSTLEVFDRAAVEGAQLLLVHHGMFWDNEPRAIGAHMKRRLERLFASGITLAAYHLPLDGHQRLGNNARLAAELRLRSRLVLGARRHSRSRCTARSRPRFRCRRWPSA